MSGGIFAPLKAGAVYFGLVFAAGFVLGTIRTIVLVPRLGELAAVAIELPVILVVSWWACGLVIQRLRPGDKSSARLVMAITAFLLLILAELALAMTMAGQTASAFVANWTTAAGALGLAGQAAFAAFPLVRHRPASI